jgi:hypothetical protein
MQKAAGNDNEPGRGENKNRLGEKIKRGDKNMIKRWRVERVNQEYERWVDDAQELSWEC